MDHPTAFNPDEICKLSEIADGDLRATAFKEMCLDSGWDAETCEIARQLMDGSVENLDSAMDLPRDEFVIRSRLKTSSQRFIYMGSRQSSEGPRDIVLLKTVVSDGVFDDKAFRKEVAISKLAADTVPGCVPIFFGVTTLNMPESNDTYRFMVMEYVEGNSLNKYPIKLSAYEVGCLVEQLADIVERLHRKGICHFDLKPEHVIFRGGSLAFPCLIDFGIGYQQSLPPTPRRSRWRLRRLFQYLVSKIDPKSTNVTKMQITGIVGTPSWNPPELNGSGMGKIDTPQSIDVYGLGAIMYFCLTKASPIPTTAIGEPARRMKPSRPKPEKGLGTVELHQFRALVTICMQCLLKRPKNRPASAGQLKKQLELWRESKPIGFWNGLIRAPANIVYYARLSLSEQSFRHPLKTYGTIGTLLVAAVALISFVLVSNYQNTRRIEREKEREIERIARIKRDAEIQKLAAEAQILADKKQRDAAIASIRQAELSRQNGDTSAALQNLLEVPEHLRKWEWHYLIREMMKHPMSIAGIVNMGISHIAVHPDNTTIALATEDGTIALGDLKTGKIVRIVREYATNVSAIAFKNDLKSLVVLDDKRIRFLEIATGEHINDVKIDFRFDGIQKTSLCKQGNRLATSNFDGKIRVFDTDTGDLIFTVNAIPPSSFQLVLSADGGLLAFAGTADFELWNCTTKTKLRSFGELSIDLGHTISSMTLHPQGLFLATGHRDGHVRIWDTTGKGRVEKAAHKNTIETVAFSPDGSLLASATKSSGRIFDPTSGKDAISPFATLTGDRNIAGNSKRLIDFNGSGQYLVGTCLVDMNLRPPHQSSQWDRGKMAVVAVNPSGKSMAVTSHFTNEPSLQIRDLSNRYTIATMEKFPRALNSPFVKFLFTPDGSHLVAIQQKTISVWNVSDGKNVLPPHELDLAYLSIGYVLSPDRTKLLTFPTHNLPNVPQLLALWDLREPKKPIWSSRTDSIQEMTFDPTGQTIIARKADSENRAWLSLFSSVDGSETPIPNSSQEIIPKAISSDLKMAAYYNRTTQKLSVERISDQSPQLDPVSVKAENSLDCFFSPKTTYFAYVLEKNGGQTSEYSIIKLTDISTDRKETEPLYKLRCTARGGLHFSPDDSRILLVKGHGFDFQSTVHDSHTGSDLISIAFASSDNAKFDPSGNLLLSNDMRGTLLSVNATPMETIPKFGPIQKLVITSICFNSNSSLIAIGFTDGSALIVERDHGEILKILEPDKKLALPLTELRFSQDGKFLFGRNRKIVADLRETLVRWDISQETPFAEHSDHWPELSQNDFFNIACISICDHMVILEHKSISPIEVQWRTTLTSADARWHRTESLRHIFEKDHALNNASKRENSRMAWLFHEGELKKIESKAKSQ